MTVLAVTGFAGLLWILLVLACPLMMMWMMRGGHGHGSHEHSRHDDDVDAQAPLMRERSTKGLRKLRDEIDQMIEEGEQAERERAEREPPVGTRR